MGEHEPNRPRKVAGANDQQNQGGRTRETAQQQQFQQGGGQMGGASGAGQMGDGAGQQATSANRFAGQIREDMEVIGADGVHLGTVDHIDGERIKLTRRDSGAGFEGGRHEGHHHYLPLGLVAAIEGDKVRLSANADVAWGMEEEQGGSGSA